MKFYKKKLLIISGPTATGKTALAVKLAKKYHGELINADSRQIYQELDIGIGKDHPKSTPIHLINLVAPDQRFSVAEYQKLAHKKISELHSKSVLPILVGGSGFYINSILSNSYDTFKVKPNKILRFFLHFLSLKFLQNIYLFLDKNEYQKLNNSDANNPRRLVRKIEIKINKLFNYKLIRNLKLEIRNYNVLHLSLTAPNQFLYDRIDKRVEDRLKIGHLKELNKLLKKYSWSDPGLQTACYLSFKNNTKTNAIKLWKYAEHSDARHQKTWFKQYQSANFIDISQPAKLGASLKLIDKWYNLTN